MQKNYHNFLLFILFSASFCSCIAWRKPLNVPASLSTCSVSDRSYYLDSLVDESAKKLNFDTTNASEILKKRFSNRSVVLIKNLHLYSLLTEFTRLEEKNKNTPANLDFLHIKQMLNQRFLITEADITTNLAELDCEKTRLISTISHLDDYNQTRINRATIGAILSGAISGVLTGAVGLYNPDSSNTEQQLLTIAGAVGGGYYGFRAFGTKRKINFFHSRNHIREIWENKPNSQIFSPSIWAFMRKDFNLKGKITNGLEIIKTAWETEEILEKNSKNFDKKLKLIVLGNGGAYNSGELQDRLNMLTTIEREIDIMKYDLKRVQQEIILGHKL
jgi:hypothetical protein